MTEVIIETPVPLGVKYKTGTKYWFLDGRLHRNNGPAIEFADGSKAWYRYGKLHRTDGPALKDVFRERAYWYSMGELHREGSPAIEFRDNTVVWYREGNLYRLDNPSYRSVNWILGEIEQHLKDMHEAEKIAAWELKKQS